MPLDDDAACGGGTPAALAAMGSTPALARLIAAGTDPHQADRCGETLPILASRSFQPECLRLLIAAGVDVGAVLHDGRSAALGAVLCRDLNASRSCPKPDAHSTASWRRSRRLHTTPRTQPPPLSSKPAWTPAATWSMAPSRGAKLGVWLLRPTPTPPSPNVALFERLLADAEFLPICLDRPPPAHPAPSI